MGKEEASSKTKREASAAPRSQGKQDEEEEEEGAAKGVNFDGEKKANFVSDFVSRRRSNSTLLPDAGG